MSILFDALTSLSVSEPTPVLDCDLGVKLRCNTEGYYGFFVECYSDFTVDWGDGTIETSSYPYPNHYYSNTGDYIVQIYDVYHVDFSYDGNYSDNGNGIFVKEFLAISDTIESVDWTFKDCAYLDRISNGVQIPFISSGYNSTFKNCSSLTSYPDGLFQIEDESMQGSVVWGFTSTFEGSGLTDVGDLMKHRSICYNGTTIFDSTFKNCTSLQAIASNTYLPPRCPSIFYGCTSLTEYGMSGTFFNDTAYAFYGSGIEWAHFDNSTSIDSTNGWNLSSMFSNCQSLTEVRFPFNTTYIGNMSNAFQGCYNLEQFNYGIVQMPSNDSLCVGSFYNCSSLYRFTLGHSSSNNINYFMNAGWTYHNDCFGNCTSLPEYNDIPSDWK